MRVSCGVFPQRHSLRRCLVLTTLAAAQHLQILRPIQRCLPRHRQMQPCLPRHTYTARTYTQNHTHTVDHKIKPYCSRLQVHLEVTSFWCPSILAVRMPTGSYSRSKGAGQSLCLALSTLVFVCFLLCNVHVCLCWTLVFTMF